MTYELTPAERKARFRAHRLNYLRKVHRAPLKQRIEEMLGPYFHATRELSADESERCLEACRAHFRFTGYDYDEDDDGFGNKRR